MAEVIHMSDRKPVTPKSVANKHLNQRYMVTFDPYAPPGEQWHWEVQFMRTYKYYGCATTLASAERQAKREIDRLSNNVVRQEERE